MCGIAGVASPDAAARDPRVVRAMLDAVAHRGPDDEGVETVGEACVGARRLAIIDLAGGHQPMANESGDVVAVQNGEIYNYLELRDELTQRGHRFLTRSDTEILPHAYEEWGPDLVPRLRGMFGLAIWDDRRRRLLLARDRFGKKPLVYSKLGHGLAFASEIQALLRHPSLSREIDETAIEAYLALGYVPAPLSAFRSIRKLPAGHLLVAHEGRVDVRRYWRLRSTPKLDISFSEAAEQLRVRIEQAVRLRLMSDVPLGVFLSGGLDSSTVVAFMSHHVAKVRTFAIGFEDARLNELPYARAVAQAFGTEHQELMVGAQNVQALPSLIRHVGEPFADSSIIPTYEVARLTRPHVKVALTGDGGDELFLGYDRYMAALAAQRVVGSVGRAAARVVAGAGRLVPTGHTIPPSVARAARFLSGLDVRDADRYLRWSGYFTDGLRREVVGERLTARPSAVWDLIGDAYNRDVPSEAERYALADVELGLPGDLLVKMDIATMAASLEARSPLLDHELAEFVARLPSSYKMTLGRSKRLLRYAMAQILPPSVLHRGKRGFVAPVGAWLRGPLSDMFNDLVPSGVAVERGWITRSGARRAYSDHMSGRHDRTRHLWSLLVLEVWWREIQGVRPAG